MDEETERPDEEAAHNRYFAGAIAGEALLKGEYSEGVEVEEAPVGCCAEGVLLNEPGHGEPAGDVGENEVPATAEEESGGEANEETAQDSEVVGESGVPGEAAEGNDAEDGDGVEREVAEAVAAREGFEAGVGGKGQAGEDVGVELDDVQCAVERSCGTVEGVGEGLDENEEEAEEPEVDGFSGMTAAKQEEDDHEDGHRGEVGKEVVVDHA